MADVKWIKLTTDMFNNRKIKHLRKLPEGNNIVLIWVMLLTMAGRCNSGGMIFLTENIPYTTKMLADELDFEESIVQLALTVLEQLNMIVTNGEFFSITGWQEYQNLEGMEKIREQTRKRVANHREKQKALLSNATCNATVTQCNATDIDKDIELDKEKDIKNNKVIRHKYGEYKNVLLSDEDYTKLLNEFPTDYMERIERLSEYMASTGKSYKNHLATIRNWSKKDKQVKTNKPETEYNRFMSELQDIYFEGD
ncbi:MAG: phage replisome organizer N-terminal domain-containing protein [Oscillospiraceae bacterium]|nr:phage replisome organizer N-terminal domain-containing protein [Oscillospiraceae bacterium]